MWVLIVKLGRVKKEKMPMTFEQVIFNWRFGKEFHLLNAFMIKSLVNHFDDVETIYDNFSIKKEALGNTRVINI